VEDRRRQSTQYVLELLRTNMSPTPLIKYYEVDEETNCQQRSVEGTTGRQDGAGDTRR
jgi:hypothetical protein